MIQGEDQFSNPANADTVRAALRLCGREDLIGMGKDCLVKPERGVFVQSQRSVKRNSPIKEEKKQANKQSKRTQSQKEKTIKVRQDKKKSNKSAK